MTLRLLPEEKDKKDGAIADGFCGLRMSYSPGCRLAEVENARDAKYMDIKVQGFVQMEAGQTNRRYIDRNES